MPDKMKTARTGPIVLGALLAGAALLMGLLGFPQTGFDLQKVCLLLGGLLLVVLGSLPRRIPFDLAGLNARLSRPRPLRLLTGLALVLLVALYLADPLLHGWLNAPPQVGDGPDYDTIALQIAHGNGFSLNWDSPEYRAPYLAQPELYQGLLLRTGTAPTTLRPPLFPAVMAAIYVIFGRQFGLVRIFNCLVMALAGVVTFRVLARRFGALPGLLGVGLFALDGRLRSYAPQVMTESLAVLLLALVTWGLFRFASERKTAWVTLTGIFAGLAVLDRSIFIFALPFLALSLYAIIYLHEKKLWNVAALRQAGLLLGLALLINAPWMIRNCLVTQAFYPLGTQGAANLYSGYSDIALQRKGVWFSMTSGGFFKDLALTHKGLDYELAIAKYSQSLGMEWIKQNWPKLPQLAFDKALDLWTPRTNFQVVLLVLGLAGLLLLPDQAELLICLGLLLFNTTAVALTYSAGDRFQIPLIPVVDILAAAGAWVLISGAAHLHRSRPGALPGAPAAPSGSAPAP
jgi:hypothetical protein